MFEAGKTYKTRDGRDFRVYATDGVEPFSVHGAIKRDDGAWYCINRTKDGKANKGRDSHADLVPDPPPLPPIDITKPCKTRAGNRVINLGKVSANRLIGDVERTGIKPLRGVEWEFDGRCYNADREHDLIQCTTRPWTRADVPWPRPEFRGINAISWLVPLWIGYDGVEFVGEGFVSWATLSANWQYSVDGGTTWLACEVAE